MEAASITQMLKGFCDNTQWKYAVFWKLNHHFPMTLTWENGYYAYQKTSEALESMWGDMKFKSPNGVYSSSCESIDDSGDYSARLLMTEMSHFKYSLGEGVVGKIALSGDHCWAFCDDILTNKFNTDLISECPYEWLLQSASGIKTIVLIPVLPKGVLQFGSIEAVAEDLEFITTVRGKFNSLNYLASNTTPLNVGVDIKAWSFSAPTNTLMDCLDESSSIATNNKSKVEASGSISLNINGSTRLNPTMPSFIENQLGSLKRANHMEEEIWASSEWVKNVGVFEETSNGLGSYSGKNMTEQQFAEIDTSHYDIKNVNDFFAFPSESELHKALKPVAYRQTAKPMSKYFSVEDTYSSSTLITNKEEHDHIKDLEFPKEVDAEFLLDAVVGNLCSASDDTSSISNSIRSSVTMPMEFTGSIQQQIHSEENTMTAKDPDVRSDHMPPAVMVEGRDDFSKHFMSLDCDENSNLDEAQKEKVYSHMQPTKGPKLSSVSKKKGRVGNTQKARPRDRQMIMDRMKELRELVPDGAKLSIDSLLDRTIKHMLYLRQITRQADKLKRFVLREVPECNKTKLKCSNPGMSYAYDFESELAWPIVIEDLECSGHMLIEMICSEHGLFLEIAQVIKKLELTILKGVLENHSSTSWARFIVEAPRGFHRMDVLCPLLHLFQLRRKPCLS